MPIRFRCGYCNRLLGIARRKAGTETTCPHCGYTITVPMPNEANDDLAEVERLLNAAGVSVPTPPEKPSLPATGLPTRAVPTTASGPRPGSSTPTRPAAATQPRPSTGPASTTSSSDDPPLFEKDLDAVLGPTGKAASRLEEPPPAPKPLPGMDATSLIQDQGHIVLSSQRATAVLVCMVVLLAISFAAGFVLGSAR